MADNKRKPCRDCPFRSATLLSQAKEAIKALQLTAKRLGSFMEEFDLSDQEHEIINDMKSVINDVISKAIPNQ